MFVVSKRKAWPFAGTDPQIDNAAHQRDYGAPTIIGGGFVAGSSELSPQTAGSYDRIPCDSIYCLTWNGLIDPIGQQQRADCVQPFPDFVDDLIPRPKCVEDDFDRDRNRRSYTDRQHLPERLFDSILCCSRNLPDGKSIH